ncbi:MAG: EamA family transporter [Rhodospirillaceae bacterium]
MPARPLPLSHMLLALAVVAVWGTNFVVIKTTLNDLPPLLFACLRFIFVFIPAAFFVRRPSVPWKQLAAYSLLISVGQFALLYIAVDGYISPGLASLVVQMQVFFTIGLSIWFNGEKVQPFQWLALLVAVSGVVVIAVFTDGSATMLGLVLVLLAGAGWAGGNTVARHAGQVDMLAYVVWASAFAIPPLAVLSFVFDGWPAIHEALRTADLATWAGVLWQSFGNTLFGYTAWGWLLARHPAAMIAPVSLLVPAFGIGASVALLGEGLPPWKIVACGLIIAGLAFNTLGPKLFASKATAVP